MDTKTLICILSICIGTDGSMQPDEVNKLKEIIKNLTSIKLKDDPVQESRVGRIFRQTDLKYRFRGA